MRKNGEGMKIGEVLRQARIKGGISQTALAKTMGLPIFTLNRVEAGTRSFDENWMSLLPIEIRAPVSKMLEKEYREKLDRLRSLRKNRFLRKGVMS
jgi:DNA-binding XRE family transcriptional regulator